MGVGRGGKSDRGAVLRWLAMDLANLVRGIELQPTAIVDIGITALLIYWLFSLIRGTRAVRLVIGLTILIAVYLAAQALGLQLLSQILQTGAVVGLLAIVVVFQPELRRALERIGRVGSLGLAGGARLGGVGRTGGGRDIPGGNGPRPERIGALIVLERETGLEEVAETGVMLHADLSADLLRTIFAPRTPLHDGAVIVHGERIIAAGVVLPLSETAVYRERFGTRHRAALGITEQTDALAIVVSEESGAVSLVERGRILRHLDEERLRTACWRCSAPDRARHGRRSASSPAPMARSVARFGCGPGGHDGAAADPPTARRRMRHAADPTDRRPRRPRRPRRRLRLPVPASRAEVRLVLAFILRNWPLKLGAVFLATVLYAGLVLAQNTRTFPARVPIEPSGHRPTRRCCRRCPT